MPGCVVLLRHGQREDYVAAGEGRGAAWISRAERPWDPPLADAGRRQCAAAARRLRGELAAAGLAEPSAIYCSPLVRCVETADIVAKEFGVQRILVEEGLTETVCEAWMRQWALPSSDSTWGGPDDAAMPPDAGELRALQGPPAINGLRPEAEAGPRALLRTAAELRAAGEAGARVDESHVSLVSVRGMEYKWGHFETHDEVEQRFMETVRRRVEEWKFGVVAMFIFTDRFVSHGGPTATAYGALVGQPVPPGSGGMTALSILRQRADGGWEPLVSNDASHAEAFHMGIKTLI